MPFLVEALAELRRGAGSESVKGRRLERLVKTALARHPGEYGAARFGWVALWDEWEGRDGSDTGIDLVAEQTDRWGGGLCAIQCKFYDESSRVAKGDLDKFISKSSHSRYTARLLVNTGAELGPKAVKTIEGVEPRCEVLTVEEMERWPVADWREFITDPESLVFDHVPHRPRPYQRDAVDRVIAGFGDHDRGKLVLPCGTGKSVVTLWAAEELVGVGGRVLYLVPSIALMGQTMREWARNRGVEHRYIGICSDTRTGRVSEDASLAELAMPVTTDPGRIAAAIGVEAPEEMTVVFCTYQSLQLVADAQADGAPPFGLAICDEAHRTTGIQAAEGGSSFTLIHEPDSVLADRRLYTTGTPRVYTAAARQKAADHVKDFDVYSMDDPAVYGPEFYRMTFSEAIEGGHLSDYQVVVIAVDEGNDAINAALENVIAEHEETGLNLEDAVKLVGCWDALADPRTRQPGGRITGTTDPDTSAGRAIAFSRTIKKSRLVEQAWPRLIEAMTSQAPDSHHELLLGCQVTHVDGKTNALDRANRVQWLREGDDTGDGVCRVLTNARCLMEGVDVPALDAVVFLEPRKSQIDIVQSVGRVMRKAEGKQYGYIVLPVVVPTGSSLTDSEVLEGSDFKHVWAVLRALRSHDDRMDVWVNAADLGGKPPLRVIDTTGDGDEDDRVDGLRTNVALQLPLEGAIASKLVEKCGDRQYWDRWAEDVAEIAGRIEQRVKRLVSDPGRPDLRQVFEGFLASMREALNDQISRGRPGCDGRPAHGHPARVRRAARGLGLRRAQPGIQGPGRAGGRP